MSLAARTDWWRPASAAEGRLEALVPSSPQPHHSSGGTVAFRALMVFTFIMILAPQAYLPALRPLRIALLAAVVGIAAGLLDSLRGGRWVRVGGLEMALTAALAAWAVVTLPLSYWPGGSASFLLDTYFKTVAIFWLLGNAVDTMPRLRKVAWGLTLMAVPLALTGIKHYFSGAFIEAHHGVRRIVGHEEGRTANPNDLALMLNVVLPLSVALLLAARSALARALLLAAVALLAAGVVVTFSRAGFLTLATTCAVYLWRLVRRGRIRWAVAALTLSLAGLAVLPAGYLSRLATITDIDSDPTGSAQVRWNDTVAAVQLVRSHPVIGAGVGMNTLALNEVRGPAWMMVHNVYLEYGVELGLPGLGLFLLLLWACLRKARGVRRRAAAVPALSELSLLAEGIEVALIAFVVAGFFYPVGYQFYFYYLAGLAVAAGVVYDKAVAHGPAGRRSAMAQAS